jgi:hypothetical protein
VNRRRFLLALGVSSVIGIAGCAGDGGPDTESSPGTGGETTTGTTDGVSGTATVSGTGTDGDSGTPTRTCLPADPNVRFAFVRGASERTPDRALSLPAGTESTVTFVVLYSFPSTDLGSMTVEGPWATDFVDRTLIDERRVAGRVTVDVPASAEGEHSMTAEVPWSFSCQEGVATVDQPIAVSPVASAPFGFDAGGWSSDAPARVDGLWFEPGTEENGGARYVEVSGDAESSPTDTAVGHLRSDAYIEGTDHQALYQTAHVGGDLGYEIAIEDGPYDVRLHFAELDEGMTAGDRVFDVTAGGTTRIESFDVMRQAGADHAAISRTLEGVEPVDGTLSIGTRSTAGDALLSGFEIRAV